MQRTRSSSTNPPTRGRMKMFILVSEAKNLLKKDIFGLSDPYVRVTYQTSSRHVKKKTSTIKKTLQPKWEEVLEFDVRGDNAFSVILDVYDENILSRDDFLGRTIMHFDMTERNRGVTPELYTTAAEIRANGVMQVKNLLNKWAARNLDGYHRLPHVREMEREFQRKRYQSIREHHNSWGQLTITYVIFDDSGASHPDRTGSLNLPYPSSPSHSSSSVSNQDSDSDSDTELPIGWERRVDSNGRRLFLNHTQRRASLRRPLQRQQLQPSQPPPQPPPQQPQQQHAAPVATGVQVMPGQEEEEEIVLHHRRFLERNHSIDMMRDQSDEESESSVTPPNPQEESVLRPLDLDSAAIGFANLTISGQDGTQGSVGAVGTTPSAPPLPVATASASTSASAAASTAASSGASAPGPSHAPQVLTALQRAAQGLPPHWQASMTPTGRIYYINHDTQTTTWEKPRYQEVRPTVSPAATGPVEQDPELPEGWEARKNKDGRTYYVDHNTRLTMWEHPLEAAKKAEERDKLGPMPPGWEEKQMKDGRIFFVDHSTHSTQWEDPRLMAKNKPTARIQYSRDYKQKYTNFVSKLGPKHQVPRHIDIPCRRDRLFEDTYNVIMNVRDVETLKARLYVIFQGESGLDYGGLAREWFHLLSHEMFNPYYGLFEYSASDDYTLQINPESATYNPNHLDYFKFIGRICGMAVYHNRLIDAFFIRPFYKMMLRKPITLEDMQSVDVEMWNSFTYILENDPDPLCLDFSVNKTVFDEVTVVDLKPNGRNIPVTEKNKKEYIDLLMKWRFTDRVQKQMDSFLAGFSDLVPLRLIKVFDERELEYLLGGLSEIDVEDWKTNTQYDGYVVTDPVIQWFWKAVENYDEEMRARLLQFVTGTSKVPMNGFSELQGSQGPRKFCLKKYGTPDSLPRAHTCFNRIDLPPYPSYHKLKEMLRLAVENTEGFEGVD